MFVEDFFFFFPFVECFSFFCVSFLKKKKKKKLICILFCNVIILKGLSQKQHNGEPLREKKPKQKSPNIFDQQMTLGLHWPKCAFKTPDSSSNLYWQHVQG